MNAVEEACGSLAVKYKTRIAIPMFYPEHIPDTRFANKGPGLLNNNTAVLFFDPDPRT